MKTLRMIRMALFAVLMCVNFASCNNDEVVPNEPTQDNYITVGLNCVGEYLDITESPLSRTSEGDEGETFLIQIYLLNENGNPNPYAYGTFKGSLDEVTVKLLQGKEYMFRVAIAKSELRSADNKIYYSSVELNDLSNISDQVSQYEAFFGELNNYTPSEGENVEINTKRISYAAKFVVENLNEGSVMVGVSNSYIGRFSVNLTPEVPTSDKIYSFYDIYSAWKGISTQTGTDDTGKPIYEYKDYTSEKKLTVNWTKEDGTVVPLGIYKVTFKRNVRTTIRIDVANLPSVSNGITVTREDTPILDDENEYEIGGGEIVEVPVDSES